MPGHRHYSWPFSGSASSSKAEELRFIPRKVDSLLSTSRTQRSADQFATFDKTFDLAPSLYSSSEEEEIMSSAGIMDPKLERRQLRRQRRERRTEHKRRRHERRQHHRSVDKSNMTEAIIDDNDGAEEIIISSIRQANEAPIAIMRRFVWPHLERARHFFLPLQTIQYLTGSWTSHSKYTGPTEKKSHEIKARYVAKLTSPSAPFLSGTRRSSADGGAMSLSIPDRNEWMLRPERRHRRCHSEQPRAWREPNPGLWTLAEE